MTAEIIAGGGYPHGVSGAEPNSNCGHEKVFFSPWHDNFYCANCKKGMGNEFYQAHRHEKENFQCN